MDFLYALPNWQIAVIIVLGTLLVEAAVMAGLHGLFRIRFDTHRHDLAIMVNAAVFGATGFIMALAIIEAKTELSTVQRLAIEEAHNITQLDEMLQRYDLSGTAAIRQSLTDYTRSIIADEWPLLAEATPLGAARTDTLLHAVSDGIARLNPTTARDGAIYGGLITGVATIDRARDTRLEEAINARLPALFWWVVSLLALMVIFASAMFEPTPVTLALIGIEIGSIGFMLAFLFIIDMPFVGESRVTPIAFDHALMTLSVQSD